MPQHLSGWTEESIKEFVAKFLGLSVVELFWGDSVIVNEEPRRLDGDPYLNAGAHIWVLLRKDG